MVFVNQHFIKLTEIPHLGLFQNPTQKPPLFTMATVNLLYCTFLLLLFSQCISTSGERQSFLTSTWNATKLLFVGRKLDEFVNPPATTTPITNPANFPPYTPTPTVVTVPASNPTSVTPLNPISPPVTTVPTSTNPVPITNPAAPVTNPATTFPSPPAEGDIPATGGDIPMTSPSTNAPVVAGQTWCIARAGAPEDSLQSALDYACGIGGADCSTIQEGASCYNPNSLENHASYAFNSYFQKNPVPTSCDFGGSAVIVNTNPSTGSCIFPSSATPAAMPSSTIPPATTSTTGSTSPPATTSTPGSTIPPATRSTSGGDTSPYGLPGSGMSPPTLLNTSNPATGSPAFYGPDFPPTGNSVPAASAVLQPTTGFIILVASFSAVKLILSLWILFF